MWQVGSRGHVRSKGGWSCEVYDGHCCMGENVWNREFGGEPGSLLLYIIVAFISTTAVVGVVVDIVVADMYADPRTPLQP